jgi:NAD+ synthase
MSDPIASPALDRLVISLAQLNPTVGDVAGNVGKLLAALAEARGQGADLLVSTELFVTGYPPEDLVRKPALLDAVEAAAAELAAATALGGPALLVGLPWRHEGKVYNAAALFERGEMRAIRFKHHLPNYGSRFAASVSAS